MIRFLASIALHLLANAAGLLIAALILDGFSIDAWTFVAVVLIFTAIEIVVEPLMTKISLKNAPALRGGVALVTTLVGLILAAWLSDGLTISGFSTWLIGALIVWLGSVLAAVILPLFLFRKATGRSPNRSV